MICNYPSKLGLSWFMCQLEVDSRTFFRKPSSTVSSDHKTEHFLDTFSAYSAFIHSQFLVQCPVRLFDLGLEPCSSLSNS